jgi:hypothetical protein
LEAAPQAATPNSRSGLDRLRPVGVPSARVCVHTDGLAGLSYGVTYKDGAMPSFQAEVKHALGQDQALERLKGFLEKVREKYKDQVSKLDGQWNDNVLQFALTTYGFKINGTLAVDDQTARLDGQMPVAALPFRGKIEKSICEALEKALA